jgi:hypothetical protein
MTKAARDWNLAKVEAGIYDDDVLGELIRRGACAIQEESNLTVDGLAGRDTIDAVETILNKRTEGVVSHDATRPQYQCPIPRRNAIESIYGSFSFKENPKTPGAIIIDPSWVRANITRLTLHTGQKLWVHRLIAFELAELYQKACTVSGYTPAKIASWVPRHMRWDKTRSLSRHSWGIAFDIDWHLNGVGMTDTPLHRHPEWAQTFRDAGWTAGIDWRTYPDPMHFERVAR